ncbi:NADH dehydrogenase (ubiquinone) 1 alpha subcomplex subunit 9 [Mytilus galloprovincialis]|uniref:NADH dehydrogenase [ubiquinone] 1 alpha subcomplex subunit 9, mitochondrial n=1 Tax=Mytilus galloprovincialis TaxID=29158 RepID=A0A8B6DF85_MYTGA|nr:NADH dehydrogenase (ubiquinone) 1 alpha subcomplex subunit 9 [Mytilus galloprovincialis]
MATLTVRQVIGLGRKDLPRCIGYYTVQKRDKSDVTIQNYKRGTGGRSSFSGEVVTVFGSTGFLGRFIVNRLGKTGSQIILPWRGDDARCWGMKPSADLGQLIMHEIDVRNDDDIRKVLKYSTAVVNLIGREFETRNFNYDDVHNVTARKIAKYSKEAGVKKLLHFSSLNASPNPPECLKKGGSDFLKSKYAGEVAVREEFPEAIIFRPADIFVRRYVNFKTPLWQKGQKTIKKPVYVTDVTDGVMSALNDPDAAGKTFELVGPGSYYLCDILDFIYKCARYPTGNICGIGPYFKARAQFFDKVQFLSHGYPRFVLDRLEKVRLLYLLCIHLYTW